MPDSREETPSASWQGDSQRFLADGTEAHRLLKRLNGEGNHLLALEVAERIIAERSFDDPVPVLQQMARALAILGSSDEALSVLRGIPEGREDEAETLGLLARVWKDLATLADDAAEAERCFRESFGSYAKGFESAVARHDTAGAAYCGINAAAVAVWLGEQAMARDFAAKASSHAEGGGDYYAVATRAEAALILGNDAEAEALYREASAMAEAGKRWADLASTRKQCRALCLRLHSRRDRMDSCFTHGAVAVVSCEPIEGGAEPAYDLRMDAELRVSAWLVDNGIRHVFLGSGGVWEEVVAAAAEARGLEIHRFASGEDAGRAFTDLMLAARGVLLASHLGVAVKSLVVADKPGMTAAARWKQCALAPHLIHPAKGAEDGPMAEDVSGSPAPFPGAVPANVEKEPVRALLILRFPGSVADKASLERLAGILTSSAHPPLSRQGLSADYGFSFAEPHHAAQMALQISSTLPGATICLHAGPVRMEVNPVLHAYLPEGEASQRAFAIAAHLPAGSVAATETFTALAALGLSRGFRFEHTGLIGVDGKTDRLFRVLPQQRP